MAEEAQEKAERLRLVYRSESAGRESDVELPFRMLVLGDFTRDGRAVFAEDNLPIVLPARDLDPVLAKLGPKLRLQVPNLLAEAADAPLEVQLEFRGLNDFSPDRVIRQVPELRGLLELRALLWRYRERGANVREIAADI
ncbi:MAG TPA: type VI secretion system contractile sheath small subunit, partial [Gammaproteobacteria bacterium]